MNFTAGEAFIISYSIFIHSIKLKINVEVHCAHEDGVMISMVEVGRLIIPDLPPGLAPQLPPLLPTLPTSASFTICSNPCYLVPGWHQVIDCLKYWLFSSKHWLARIVGSFERWWGERTWDRGLGYDCVISIVSHTFTCFWLWLKSPLWWPCTCL